MKELGILSIECSRSMSISGSLLMTADRSSAHRGTAAEALSLESRRAVAKSKRMCSPTVKGQL